MIFIFLVALHLTQVIGYTGVYTEPNPTEPPEWWQTFEYPAVSVEGDKERPRPPGTQPSVTQFGVYDVSDEYSEVAPTTSSVGVAAEFGIYDPYPIPIIQKHPETVITVEEGSALEFKCSATDVADHEPGEHDHELRVDIHFDGDLRAKLDSGERGFQGAGSTTRKFTKNKAGRLEINEISELYLYKPAAELSDQGWYRCRACIDGDNEFGDFIQICDTQNIEFQVQVNPRKDGGQDDSFDATVTPSPTPGVPGMGIPKRTCQVFGDPHIMTFDGKYFQGAMTSCTYLLALDREEFTYFIYGTFSECGGKATGSCLETITIFSGQEVLGMYRGWMVSSRGKKYEMLSNLVLNLNPFEVSFDGTHLTVNLKTANNKEITVSWDGYVSAHIQVPTAVASEGLCGNNDGDSSNDLAIWGAPNESIMDLCNYMKVDREGRCSSGVEPANSRDICSKKELKKAKKVCESLIYDKAFKSCTHEKESFVEACVYDQCKGINVINYFYREFIIEDIDERMTPACIVAANYAYRCSQPFWHEDGSVEAEIPSLANWETTECANNEFKRLIIPKLGCPQEATEYRAKLF